MRLVLDFFAASIESLSSASGDNWGVTLFKRWLRFNVGWVNALVIAESGLVVLIDKKTAPSGVTLNGSRYRNAPGCDTTTVPLSKLSEVLPSLAASHRKATAIAARRRTHRGIRESHSPGVIKYLSEFLRRQIPNPSYAAQVALHLLNGGYGNGDKKLLERVVGSGRRDKMWVVPKAAAIGDEVVINIAQFGLFAMGKIASRPSPRADWKNRYGADLKDIQLIQPAISLAEVKRLIPELKWARYARSITTPSPEVAEKVRGLIAVTVKSRDDIDRESPSNILDIASLDLLRPASKAQRLINQRIRSAKVRRFVLQRASGVCEGCGSPAPFKDRRGLPFLETHHTKRVADDGPDNPRYVVALCPNCHRRTDFSEDARSFNDFLNDQLRKKYSGR